MKITSIFVAVSLALCQFAAAVPTASSTGSINVQWWTLPNFQGSTSSGDAEPGKCYSLPAPFEGTIQSIQVDDESSCAFFIADSCGGPSLTVLGNIATLPAPYINNTLSYQCEDL